MKRLIAFLGCLIICACCVFAVSCGNGNTKSDNLFVFLSVRIKGNGDGTVTAVAQNEFAIGFAELPVTLTLYSSDEYQTDVTKMTELESSSSEDLNIYGKIKIISQVGAQCYYCARITYSVGGDTKYIQSDTVQYGTDGKRI